MNNEADGQAAAARASLAARIFARGHTSAFGIFSPAASLECFLNRRCSYKIIFARELPPTEVPLLRLSWPTQLRAGRAQYIGRLLSVADTCAAAAELLMTRIYCREPERKNNNTEERRRAEQRRRHESKRSQHINTFEADFARALRDEKP